MHCFHPHNRLPEPATDTLPDVPHIFSRGES
jgi:hypothetical protein